MPVKMTVLRLQLHYKSKYCTAAKFLETESAESRRPVNTLHAGCITVVTSSGQESETWKKP